MFRKSLLVLGLLAAANANAAVIFSDNFDSNALALNGIPNGWTVDNGTVDIIGKKNNVVSFDFIPGNGAYIDLDGSSSDAGKLYKNFNFNAGLTYTVSFDLAGNHRGSSDTVQVNFGSAQQSYTLASATGFTNYSLSFTAANTGPYQLSFENIYKNTRGDNIGLLLDNVKISAVPLPAASWLFLTSLFGFLGLRRKAA